MGVCIGMGRHQAQTHEPNHRPATPSDWQTACTVHGPLFTLKASAVCNVRRKNGIASPTPCASPKRSVVRTVLYANWAVIQRQFSNAPGLTHSLVYLAADAAPFQASARIWITSANASFLAYPVFTHTPKI